MTNTISDICSIFKPKLNKYGENVKGKIRMGKGKERKKMMSFKY